MKYYIESDVTGIFSLEIIVKLLSSWNIDLSGAELVKNIKQLPHWVFSDPGCGGKIILPSERGVFFIYSATMHSDETSVFGGACVGDSEPSISGDSISVAYLGTESSKVVELRFVHEWLHAQELPADDMNKHFANFLLPLHRVLRRIFLALQITNTEYYQEKYYRWLLLQRSLEKM